MNTQKTLETLLQTIERLEEQLASATQKQTTTNESGFLKFNEKEIIQMPQSFRKKFRLNGCTVHVRKRDTGRYKCSYEIRYARDGYNISVSATTLEAVKKRFIEKIKTVALQKENNGQMQVPKNFDKFAMFWFENYHKRKVAEKTYKGNLGIYRRHIEQKLSPYDLSQIQPQLLQGLLDNLPGNGKTADDVYNILNQVFNCAVKYGLVKLNPLGMCFHERHETTPGTALTKAEETLLLDTYANTEYQLYFAVILYTGLRPNEYPTAVIDGQFIKAKNSKRHGNKDKIEYKKIPITPMLRPYLKDVNQLAVPRAKIVERRFKKLFPQHSLKDMRMTFQTRCDQCGIPDKVIGIIMGNTIGGGLKRAYTDLDNPEYLQYLYEEGQKLQY